METAPRLSSILAAIMPAATRTSLWSKRNSLVQKVARTWARLPERGCQYVVPDDPARRQTPAPQQHMCGHDDLAEPSRQGQRQGDRFCCVVKLCWTRIPMPCATSSSVSMTTRSRRGHPTGRSRLFSWSKPRTAVGTAPPGLELWRRANPSLSTGSKLPPSGPTSTG